MPHRSRLIAALACLALLPAAEQKILRPSDGDVLPPAQPLVVIASGSGELLLDGKAVATQSPAPGVVTAQIQPSEGPHELALGAARVRFTVSAAGATFRAHPPGAGCDSCHSVASGVWAIKGDDIAANCLQCHARETFVKPHQHNPETLNECSLCHLPHGSSAAKHLKLTKAIACKQCHG